MSFLCMLRGGPGMPLGGPGPSGEAAGFVRVVGGRGLGLGNAGPGHTESQTTRIPGGEGEARMAERWQDWAKKAAKATAQGVGRAARAVHDAAASPEGQRVAAEAKKVGKAAVSAVGTAAKKAAPVVRDAARKAAPVVKQAAEKAAPVVEDFAGKAAHAARSAADRVREGYRSVAAERELHEGASRGSDATAPGIGRGIAGANATVRDVRPDSGASRVAADPGAGSAGRSASDGSDASAATGRASSGAPDATGFADHAPANTPEASASSARPGHPFRSDGRPQVSVDDATGQPVQTEVYVINEDGSRDYNVFPRENPAREMGPIARRIAGLVLILAGIPMLVLPGPGLIAIAAGLALMGGKSLAQDSCQAQGPTRQTTRRSDAAPDSKTAPSSRDESPR